MRNAIDSNSARCGKPKYEPNEDEQRIRDVIKKSKGGFQAVDQTVEIIRICYLLEMADKPVSSTTFNPMKYQREREYSVKMFYYGVSTVISRIPGIDVPSFSDFIKHHRKRATEKKQDANKAVGQSELSAFNNPKSSFMMKIGGNEKIDVSKEWKKKVIDAVNSLTNYQGTEKSKDCDLMVQISDVTDPGSLEMVATNDNNKLSDKAVLQDEMKTVDGRGYSYDEWDDDEDSSFSLARTLATTPKSLLTSSAIFDTSLS